MKVLTTARKELKILARDRMAFVTLLAMPLMFIVIMSMALSGAFGEGEVRFTIPVADLDHSALSESLGDRLDAVPGVTVERTSSQDGRDVPMTEAELAKRVGEGRYSAGLVIPAGFGDAVPAGNPALLRVLTDPADATGGGVASGVIQGAVGPTVGSAQARALVTAIFDALRESLGAIPGLDLAGIEQAVRQRITGAFAAASVELRTEPAVESKAERLPGVYEQNVPGYTVLFAFFAVNAIAASVIAERHQGTFRRILVAPVARASILAGKLLAFFIMALAQIAILLGAGRLVFGMSLGDEPLALLPLTLALALSATGLGVLLSSLVRTEQQAGSIGSLVVLTMGALGGAMVPRFVMPEAMRTAGLITPQAWAIDGYQDVIVRGMGLPDVLPHVAALLGFAALFFAAGLLRFRFE